MLPVHAESDPLKPADTVQENGNIVLHKQATRIATDEWEIDVQAKINDTHVEPPKLEVTFVLDASGSMFACEEETLHNVIPAWHDHKTFQCSIICDNTNADHVHTNPCYSCGDYTRYHYGSNKNCYYINDEVVKVVYESRFTIAKQVINKMVEELPVGTQIGRVAFNIDDHAEKCDDFDSVYPTGDTFLMDGVGLALTSDCFTNSSHEFISKRPSPFLSVRYPRVLFRKLPLPRQQPLRVRLLRLPLPNPTNLQVPFQILATSDWDCGSVLFCCPRVQS